MKRTRITLPVGSSNEMLELAKKVLAKHLAEGSNSALNGLDWETLKPAIEKANQLHQEAEDHRVQSTMRIEERNKLLAEIKTGMRSSRNVLSGVRIKNMRSLGEWGFNVVESTPTKTKAVSSITESAKITPVQESAVKA